MENDIVQTKLRYSPRTSIIYKKNGLENADCIYCFRPSNVGYDMNVKEAAIYLSSL